MKQSAIKWLLKNSKSERLKMIVLILANAFFSVLSILFAFAIKGVVSFAILYELSFYDCFDFFESSTWPLRETSYRNPIYNCSSIVGNCKETVSNNNSVGIVNPVNRTVVAGRGRFHIFKGLFEFKHQAKFFF